MKTTSAATARAHSAPAYGDLGLTTAPPPQTHGTRRVTWAIRWGSKHGDTPIKIFSLGLYLCVYIYIFIQWEKRGTWVIFWEHLSLGNLQMPIDGHY